MTTDRRRVAEAAASALEQLSDSELRSVRALVGFDGFVDSIIRVVGKRHSMASEDFEPIRSIPAFAERCASAANKSTNMELHIAERRFGGNGPLMASALGAVGAGVTFVGAVGLEENPSRLSPVYRPMADRCEAVYPIAPAAETDALEFDDGKIMLCKTANVQSVTWKLLRISVGLGRITELCERARLISVVNWVMLQGVEGIWRGLMDEVFPRLSSAHGRRVFIDLCDPAKRTDEDLSRAAGMLVEMNGMIPVTLGLNQAEAERLGRALGVDLYAGPGNQSLGSAMEHAARAIRERLGLACVVVHPREGAAAAEASGSAWFEGPFTQRPRISTGAGDHFNGGFALAQCLGLPLAQCLAVGCAVSGAYVRDAQSPGRGRLVEFLRDLPRAQEA